MKRIGVLHLIDALDMGGAERVAVNLVNHLPRNRYELHLCATRRDGPLLSEIANDVGRLCLKRRHALDVRALRQLVRYIRCHSIELLHAHSTSLFLAVAATLFQRFPRVIWHDHFGRYATESRQSWIYRLAAMRVSGVVAVNEPLAEWSRQRLGIPGDRVWCIPNFVAEPVHRTVASLPSLPGSPGSRIVCVANLRPQKDHVTLLRAMRLVIDQVPEARLFLIGAPVDPDCLRQIESEIADGNLHQNVSWLGERSDVYGMLQVCDVAVLSSVSEGSPLALVEYGMAGLPTVATSVGQCPEILDHGRAGILVPPRSPERLAGGILHFLKSSEARAKFGQRFRECVQKNHSGNGLIKEVSEAYEAVLGWHTRGPA